MRPLQALKTLASALWNAYLIEVTERLGDNAEQRYLLMSLKIVIFAKMVVAVYAVY
jgi:hypothetical protein